MSTESAAAAPTNPFGLDPEILQRYLEPVTFPAGARLIRQGEPGDACYFIDAGEVRIEVERPDLDSDGVVGYLHPGTLCGEFSLLDDGPRSASAYAATDVRARRLTRTRLDELSREAPEAGLTLLRSLGRDAAEKARAYSKALEEFIFSGGRDPEVDRMVAAAAAAQAELETWPEERVDALLVALSDGLLELAGELAEATVAETGLGNVADKIVKNRFACTEVLATLDGRPGTGARPGERAGVTEIASPMGVILGLIPVTNPVSTLVYKTLICLKARNALIASVHQAALGTGRRTVEAIRAVLTGEGAPADLVQCIRRTSRQRTARFMRHPGVALILATGGAAMVKAAYSSGTPAIGVGSGNAPVWVAPDADLAAAARNVAGSKSFDNGLICGSENNLVVDAGVREAFAAELGRAGARVLDEEEVARLRAWAFDPESGRLLGRALGHPAAAIADGAAITHDEGLKLLVVPLGPDRLDDAFAREKLAPVVSLLTVGGEEEALAVCAALLGAQGAGHTAIVHTADDARAARFAAAMPASRILVNGPGAQGCIGFGNGLVPALTLGCGTYGGTSTTDNVTYTNLLNIKRVAVSRRT
jgi:acyl-CoA reductase-like NAD-dependent aldehyde dehydrogenase